MAEANPQAVQGQEQKKEKGTLERVVDEIWNAGKKTIAVAAIAAMPFLYYPFAPAHVARAAVTTYGFAAGKVTANLIQEKDPLEGIVWQGATGAMLSYPFAQSFNALDNLEARMTPQYGVATTKAVKAGAWVFGGQPALTTGRTALIYGLGKKFRENWWPSIKNTFKYLGLYGALVVTVASQYGLLAQMIASATGSYILNLVESLRGGKGSVKNLFSALNPFSYLRATANIAKSLLYHPFKALYETGKTFGSYKLAGQATPPARGPAQ